MASSTRRPIAKDHGEQGQRINGEIEDLEAGKGTQQRYRDGDERDQRRPAALEEDINDEGDQQQGLDEGFNNFMNRRRNEGRAIVDDFIIHISRESLLSLFQDLAGTLTDCMALASAVRLIMKPAACRQLTVSGTE